MSKKIKPKERTLKGEIIGGPMTKEQCRAIMPFLLEAMEEMYQEDLKKQTKD